MTGAEAALLDEIEGLLPAGARTERDALGSLIVRFGDPAASVERLLLVGVDEPGYVVSQVRSDGWLRVRFLGGRVDETFHLAREGRPARVLTREAPIAGVPGVFAVDSIHLRGTRPEPYGEEHQWLDVGADSAKDVAALGIDLLDPVVVREIVPVAGGRLAGPSLGRRAASWALLHAARELSRAAADGGQDALPRAGVALAFVAQSLPARGGPGRGVEAVLRRLAEPGRDAPREVVLLDAVEGGDEPVVQAEWPLPEAQRSARLALRVVQLDRMVETVALADVEALVARLRAALEHGAIR
jgi:hypothetical protein